ncbi:MAG: EAL domain-containing protein, partial [Spirochaetaceae bacterium]|nr:EAL domain-containing protein [Spirochaetaceae bacterium]
EKQSKQNITKIADILPEILKEEIPLGENKIIISVSIGISSKRDQILSTANLALKQAKKRMESYILYDDSMNVSGKYQNNLKQLYQIQKIINGNGVIPYFQPIIDNQSGKIEKFECLMRLVDKDEVLSPIQFMELSKRAKMYNTLTKIMIEKSIDYFKNLNCDFSINLCINDILNRETTKFLIDKITEHNIGKRIIIEFLETDRIENNPEVLRFIRQLKELNCRIAIDDFGSGYSNFDFILRMDFDFLKIDSALIKNIVSDKNAQIMIETIVVFTRKLQIKTIAEFVHNKEVYEKIISLGIDYSQGYYIGKPEPELLDSRSFFL